MLSRDLKIRGLLVLGSWLVVDSGSRLVHEQTKLNIHKVYEHKPT